MSDMRDLIYIGEDEAEIYAGLVSIDQLSSQIRAQGVAPELRFNVIDTSLDWSRLAEAHELPKGEPCTFHLVGMRWHGFLANTVTSNGRASFNFRLIEALEDLAT